MKKKPRVPGKNKEKSTVGYASEAGRISSKSLLKKRKPLRSSKEFSQEDDLSIEEVIFEARRTGLVPKFENKNICICLFCKLPIGKTNLHSHGCAP